jgi:hypothetical protein
MRRVEMHWICYSIVWITTFLLAAFLGCWIIFFCIRLFSISCLYLSRLRFGCLVSAIGFAILIHLMLFIITYLICIIFLIALLIILYFRLCFAYLFFICLHFYQFYQFYCFCYFISSLLSSHTALYLPHIFYHFLYFTYIIFLTPHNLPNFIMNSIALLFFYLSMVVIPYLFFSGNSAIKLAI